MINKTFQISWSFDINKTVKIPNFQNPMNFKILKFRSQFRAKKFESGAKKGGGGEKNESLGEKVTKL